MNDYKYKIKLFTHLSVKTYTERDMVIMQRKLKKLQSTFGRDNVHIVRLKKGYHND